MEINLGPPAGSPWKIKERAKKREAFLREKREAFLRGVKAGQAGERERTILWLRYREEHELAEQYAQASRQGEAHKESDDGG